MPEAYVDSYYAATCNATAARAPLQGAVETETCIVGGGLAGLTTALCLAEAGRPAVLLEAQRVGWGASGRNGGIVSAGGFARGLEDLVERLGVDHARRLYDLSRGGWAFMRERIERHGIDCAPAPGMLRPSWFDAPDELRRYRDFMAQTFGQRFEFVPRERLAEMLSSPRYYDALYSDEILHIHPLNYALGIARAAEAAGARLHEYSPAVGLAHQGAGYRVSTPAGSVTARHVLLAQGGYQSGLDGRAARASLPIATYMIATRPLPAERLRQAIRVPYAVADSRIATDYYRALPDRRLLWGGRVSARLGQPRRLARQMAADVARVYPQLAGIEVEHAWMGTMSYAVHRMPMIGRSAPGLWHAYGFGGRGLNTTAMAGQLIAAAIAADDDRWRLFEPFGQPFAGGAIGRLAAQLRYWAWQAGDAWRARRRA